MAAPLSSSGSSPTYLFLDVIPTDFEFRTPSQRQVFLLLNRRSTHIFMVVLIILDVIAVSVEMFLTHTKYGKKHHDLEEGVAAASMAMLFMFLAESLMQLYATGVISFLKSPAKIITLVVISVAIILEFSLEEEGQGFLEIVLFYRVFRVLHATQEAKHGVHSVAAHGADHGHGQSYARFDEFGGQDADVDLVSL